MRILSISHALPSLRVTNEDLVRRLVDMNRAGRSEEELRGLGDFLRARLESAGAVERYHRAPRERAVSFGVTAARAALDRAGISPQAVDLLIYTGVGRGFLEPATANVFQSELGLVGATCFDILDACASWLRGLQVAEALMRGGSFRHAMLLNCEFNFREYEPSSIGSVDELRTLWAGYTVGEAATATILSSRRSDEDFYATFKNVGCHLDLCQIPLRQAREFLNGDARPKREPLRFYAQTDALARYAVKSLHDQYWEDPRLPSLDYDVIFGHSASVPLSQTVLRSLKLDSSRHIEVFPEYGNTVSAGLPLAISLAVEQKRLVRGNRVLLIMGGAGITTGLCSFVF